MIIGNHDTYYKNTNSVNSPNLLLQTYNNVKTYSKPTEVNVGGLDILFLPWINQENETDTFKLVQKTKCSCVMGHLEFQGFRVNRQLVMEHGLDSTIFQKFDRVYSGHYHTRSNIGNIFYLGNPYEIYWTDVNDTRGFHIFDTETLEHVSIDNPYKLFHNIYYEDTPYQTFNSSQYQNKIVKVIVRKKSKQKDFEKFLDKLYESGIQELKIIENFDVQNVEDFKIDEEENTISILNRYIDECEIQYDKSIVKGIFQSIYRQACEVE